MRTVHFDHGSQLWFIRETNANEERESKGGWLNCSEAEAAMDGPGVQYGAWKPVVHHGIWPEGTK